MVCIRVWSFPNVCVTLCGVREQSEHLAKRIEQQRKALGYSPTGLATATGLSLQAIKNIRKGEIRQYQDRTTGPLTRVLGWTPDSIERLLRGEEPEPLTIQPGDDVRHQVDALTRVLRVTLNLLKESLDSDEQLRQISEALDSLDTGPQRHAQ